MKRTSHTSRFVATIATALQTPSPVSAPVLVKKDGFVAVDRGALDEAAAS